MPVLPLNTGAVYIGGEWVRTAIDAAAPVINPATEETIALAPVGGAREADDAVGAARAAFDGGIWPRMAPRERAQVLRRFLAELEDRADAIKDLIVAEAGSTRALAHSLQFAIPMRHAHYAVDAAELDLSRPLPPVLTRGAAGTTLGSGMMVRDPVGVVAAITAYNFPFFLNLAKIVPALAVGCTVVLKPSPYTPFEALILGDVADAAGLPPGVLNIVTGGADVGTILTTDPRVDLVTFTGSDQVGAAIQAQAAPTLKRVLLELGGKSALIVRADANLASAAAAGFGGISTHSGQGCSLLTRHIVHNSVRADYVERLAAMARGVTIGDPADANVNFGPLIRDVARQRTEDYVAIGVQEGARLVVGGKRPPHLDKGFFYEPTVFDDVDNRSRLAQEEVFGPVAVVIGFDTDDEAIALANDSAFGLGGGIFSADVGHAYEMALRMRTGGVSINGGAGTMSPHAPFGGIRRSGYGREYGVEGLQEFTQIKSISFRAA